MDGLGMQLERNVFVNSITNEFDDKILTNTGFYINIIVMNSLRVL